MFNPEPASELSRAALFQILFVLQNETSSFVKLGDVTLSPLDLGWDTALLAPHDTATEENSYYPQSVKFNCQKYLNAFPGESLGTLDKALAELGKEMKMHAALSVGSL